jgi:hypothetical protein
VDTNTICIDLTSKDGREVVENLLRAADAPGAIIRRAKNGAAITFRSTRPHEKTPYAVPGMDHHQRKFDLASRDGTTRLTISTESAAPLDIPATHELPVMPYTAADVGGRVVRAAFALGLTWGSQVDEELAVEKRVAQFREDVKAGLVKLRTPEEIAEDDLARRDAELVKNAEGCEYVWTDGPHAQVILQARARHKLRQSKQTTTAA